MTHYLLKMGKFTMGKFLNLLSHLLITTSLCRDTFGFGNCFLLKNYKIEKGDTQ